MQAGERGGTGQTLEGRIVSRGGNGEIGRHRGASICIREKVYIDNGGLCSSLE